MKKFSKVMASLLAGGVMVAGSLTLASPAGAATAATCPNFERTTITIPLTAPILRSVVEPIRAWSIDNVLIRSNSTTCFYVGNAFALASFETPKLIRLEEWGYAHPLDL